MTLLALEPLHIRRHAGDIHVPAGRCFELPADEGTRLLLKAPNWVQVVDTPLSMNGIRPGDLVEWLSPALPKQQGEVLAVHPDGTFDVYHPLSGTLCRLPIAWIVKVNGRCQ